MVGVGKGFWVMVSGVDIFKKDVVFWDMDVWKFCFLCCYFGCILIGCIVM